MGHREDFESKGSGKDASCATMQNVYILRISFMVHMADH